MVAVLESIIGMSTWLLLGRTGDLLSILPFLKAEADAGQKPTLIVSNQHTAVLEGVSYVNVVPFEGGIHLLRQAWDWANAHYPKVKSLQVIGASKDVGEITYGPAGQKHAQTTSFVKEYWKLAGHLVHWDECWPLVFDQRSPERETKLLQDVGLVRRKGQRGRPSKERPLILVACKGNSSPFPYADLMLELIRGRFGQTYQVLELPQAGRIYDLLALYERAHCLVATDSAPLHLARAVPSLPVIALTNDRPLFWNGSPWMPQWVWCCRYHDWPERALKFLFAIETARRNPKSQLIHVWNAYEDQCCEYIGAKETPVLLGSCGRDSANVLKDQKRIPYLRDCLRMGFQRATDNEWVYLTRPDTRFNNTAAMMDHKASFAYRLTRNGTDDTFSPICDMFCARKNWWQAHLAEIPDLLFGNDYHWSEALRVMFQKHGAKDVTGVCYREPKAKV
jgi:hypothetical protein